MKIDRLFKEPTATELEHKREKARWKWRITYDCFNTRERGEEVICAKGHYLGRTGSMPLLSVLAGRSSLKCKHCQDYDSD